MRSYNNNFDCVGSGNPLSLLDKMAMNLTRFKILCDDYRFGFLGDKGT